MAKGKKTGGRRPGSKNKLTVELKQMVLNALSEAGGEQYLLTQARENPNAFLTLVGKVLPLQANVEHGVSQGLADMLLALAKGRQ